MKPTFTELCKQFLYETFKDTSLQAFLKKKYLSLFEKNKEQEQNAVFKKHAEAVIRSFADCMETHDIAYTLAYGSMLGAVREHGFIKHDLDIDVHVWYDNNHNFVRECLESYGFKLVRYITVDEDKTAREETYSKDGVSIDVFYIYVAENGQPYSCCFAKFRDCVSWNMSIYRHGGLMPRRFELPFTHERVKVPFEGLELYIQKNAHDLLQMVYGKDYMTPNPTWEADFQNPHVIEWTEKVAKLVRVAE